MESGKSECGDFRGYPSTTALLAHGTRRQAKPGEAGAEAVRIHGSELGGHLDFPPDYRKRRGWHPVEGAVEVASPGEGLSPSDPPCRQEPERLKVRLPQAVVAALEAGKFLEGHAEVPSRGKKPSPLPGLSCRPIRWPLRLYMQHKG